MTTGRRANSPHFDLVADHGASVRPYQPLEANDIQPTVLELQPQCDDRRAPFSNELDHVANGQTESSKRAKAEPSRSRSDVGRASASDAEPNAGLRGRFTSPQRTARAGHQMSAEPSTSPGGKMSMTVSSVRRTSPRGEVSTTRITAPCAPEDEPTSPTTCSPSTLTLASKSRRAG